MTQSFDDTCEPKAMLNGPDGVAASLTWPRRYELSSYCLAYGMYVSEAAGPATRSQSRFDWSGHRQPRLAIAVAGAAAQQRVLFAVVHIAIIMPKET
eukprot:5041351-Pleurochrysis_carterae.AAC.2